MPRVRHGRHSAGSRQALGHGLESATRKDTPTSIARELGPCVYAVRTPDRLIKIGYTTDLDRRIRGFGSVWDDVLLALPGTPNDEAALHARFAPYLARGREYYFPTIEIRQWINAERDRLGAAAIA